MPDASEHNDRSSPQPERDGPSAPGGFGLLARRIWDWTSKLLVSASILTGGLAVGRQMIAWWRVDRAGAGSDASSLLPGPLGARGQAHDLLFGDGAWGLRRLSIAGDSARATSALAQACREMMGRAGLAQKPASAAEQALLARLSEAKPIDEQIGKWRLYALPGGFPLVAGVCQVASEPESGGPIVAASAWRVVTYGIAVPLAEADWAGYVFHPQGHSAEPSQLSGELTIPPGSHRILAMHAQDGPSLAAFRGQGPVESWMGYYDGWFTKRGWQQAQPWRQNQGTWRTGYARRGPPGGWANVQIASDADGSWRGLLLLEETKR